MLHQWMTGIVTAAAAAVLLAGAPPAVAAGIVDYHLSAPSEKLGHAIPYAVYRPFESPAPGERWPVVYLLHGYSGKDGDLFTWGNLGPILDRAIGEGRIRPMVVVAPAAGDTWYVDNPDPGGAGPIATALATDLVAAVDGSLPTLACRGGRAIGGLSMGGSGALSVAFAHPEEYVAAMSFSGAITPPIGKDDPRLKWDMRYYNGAYGTPFDPARFNRDNLLNRVHRLSMKPERPKVWMFIGDDDEHQDFITGAAALHVALLEAGISSEFRVGPGRHFWEAWQQAIIPALEWLSPQLATTCAK
jgi:enterochelin esterase family protein